MMKPYTSSLFLGTPEAYGKMWRMHLWHKLASGPAKPVAELRRLADGKFSVHMTCGISERQCRAVTRLIDEGIDILKDFAHP